MSVVQTVTGPVDSSKLGFTLPHEHVLVLSEGVVANFPQLWNREAFRAQAVAKLREAVHLGVNTIVDLTVLGTGRDVPLVRDIARESGMQVIAATGVYAYDALPFYFANRSEDCMADLFVSDVESGIQGTGARAGILKCATDEAGVTPGVEKALRAVARAHRRTGVPISTHTHAASLQGLAQQRIFREEGVDLSRCIIGHSGDTEDLAYLEGLIDAGSYIGMDRFGLESILSTEKRVAVVAELCARGRADRLLLSHDACCYMDWMEPSAVVESFPRWNLRHIPEDVLPALLRAGVTEELIRTMTVDNPRRIFEQQGGY